MSRLLSHTARPYGVVQDVPPHIADPGFWNEAVGVDFEDGSAERQRGYTYQTPKPLLQPESLLYIRQQSDNWYYGGAYGMAFSQGGTHYDLTPAGFPVGSLQLGETTWTSLNDVPVWNNPDWTPHYHDGIAANPMAELPNWPEGWSCRVVRAFKFFLLALGVKDLTGSYFNQVRWSASANVGNIPDQWTPSPTNDAGDMFFGSPTGPIVDALPLGDNLIVYKENGTYMMQYIGGIYVFSPRDVFETSGMLTPDCAVEWRGRHFVATNGDILLHDGVDGQSIADKAVRKAIFGNISAQYAARCFCYHDPADLSMVFAYPSLASDGWCDTAARWNYRDDKWDIKEIGPDEISHAASGNYVTTGLVLDWDSDTGEWDADSSQWNETNASGVSSKTLLGLHDAIELAQPTEGGSRAGQNVQTRLSWLDKDISALAGGPSRDLITVDKLWIDAAGVADLNVRVGFAECPGGAVRWNASRVLTVGDDAYVPVLATGRLLSIEITADTSNDFKINGMTVDYRMAGR